MRYALILIALLINGGCAGIGMHQTGCATFVICPEGPEIVPSAATQLLNLPAPNNKAVVAVYNFTDKTGQVIT